MMKMGRRYKSKMKQKKLLKMKQQITLMQKALIASVFFIFFIPKITAQHIRLDGTYCATDYITDFGKCLTFKKDNTFKYISGNDLPSNIVGEGTFEINKNLLILNYKYSDPYILSYHKISKTFSNQDSISYHFKVRDINGIGIPGTEVIFKNPETKKTNGLILDKEGEGKLILPKSAATLQLRFSYIGYNAHTVEIKRDFDYSVDVFLSKAGQNLPITPHSETFEIFTEQDSSIHFRNSRGELSIWFKRE